ncbi:hypothetical protein N7510_007158 [Penicillium lagena]|uniref:uncharacterized protein n=1 Tax=Penicillium lagena TaxID=94218 RepID=UPI002541D3B9|nr:uncharacterized protein N7510_007158 [Penicillium lagena]KAJ5610439.1 hypothetical protein N7510_007158 [Penicillium lagena]
MSLPVSSSFNLGFRGAFHSPLTMRSSGLRPLLGLFCLFIGWALADRTLKDLKASELLEMIPAGKPGSCADEPMDQTLQDAALLAQNAYDAIDKLISNTKIENTDENVNLLNMAYISFGVKYGIYWDCDDPDLDPKKPMPLVITGGINSLLQAQDNFELASDRLKMDKQQIKMECGDEDLRKVTTLGDLGLEPEDETIKAYQEKEDPSKKTSDADVVGYYLSEYFSPQVKLGVYDMKTALLLAYDVPKVYAMSGPCQSVGGLFFREAQMMMLCRWQFELKSVEQAIKDQDKIREKPDMDKALDGEKTTGATFLHETLHWVNPKITDVVFRAKGYAGEVTAYKSRRSRLLAFDKSRVDDTLVNADSYVMFATGVTLKKTNWYPNGYEENVGL